MNVLKDKELQLYLKCRGWPGQSVRNGADSFTATRVLLQASIFSGVWYHDMQGEDHLSKPQSQRVSGGVFSRGKESAKCSLKKLLCAIFVSQEFRATTRLLTDLANSNSGIIPLCP